VNLLNGLAPLSVLLVGGVMVIEGETTIGVVVAFISGFDRLSTSLRELIAYYRVAAQAAVQHRMIARWM
jgi:ABC-type bacteriocin/lantibiotic exporter with double-glycine peptidase domain